MENGREKMTVSGLGEGTYSFKVVVTGSDPVRAEGEGLGVVTVLPRESIIDGARARGKRIARCVTCNLDIEYKGTFWVYTTDRLVQISGTKAKTCTNQKNVLRNIKLY